MALNKLSIDKVNLKDKRVLMRYVHQLMSFNAISKLLTSGQGQAGRRAEQKPGTAGAFHHDHVAICK